MKLGGIWSYLEQFGSIWTYLELFGSCGGLWPLIKAFFALTAKKMVFLCCFYPLSAILANLETKKGKIKIIPKSQNVQRFHKIFQNPFKKSENFFRILNKINIYIYIYFWELPQGGTFEKYIFLEMTSGCTFEKYIFLEVASGRYF